MKNQKIMEWKRKEASAKATNADPPSVNGSVTAIVGMSAPPRSSKKPNKVVESLATDSVAQSVDENLVRESVGIGSALPVGGEVSVYSLGELSLHSNFNNPHSQSHMKGNEKTRQIIMQTTSRKKRGGKTTSSKKKRKIEQY